PDAHFHRGMARLWRRPRLVLPALQDLSRALALRPGWGEALFYRACALSYEDRWEEVLADLAAAEVAHQPGEFAMRDLHLLRGHAHYQREEWEEARAAYEQYQAMASSGAP